jgi:hypothetical protein
MKKKQYVPHKLIDEKMEYREYLDKLSAEEREYVKKFYEQLYAGGVYDGDSEELAESFVREANKNYNSLTRDLLDVAKDNGLLKNLDENDTRFMEDACDEWSWRDEFDKHGYRHAALMIYEQTENDLKNSQIDVKVTLTRFYEKMNSLKRLNWRERKHKRKQK